MLLQYSFTLKKTLHTEKDDFTIDKASEKLGRITGIAAQLKHDNSTASPAKLYYVL